MADTSLTESKIGLLIWQLSNLWQSRLRLILKSFDLTLNEYLILESIIKLKLIKNNLYQNEISKFSGIDISVASVTFKLLESKNLITRSMKIDYRKKNIKMTEKGINLHIKISPLIIEEENNIFNKLDTETNNFKNSLKFLLGKNIRIRAQNIL